jgi:hypothetical protein
MRVPLCLRGLPLTRSLNTYCPIDTAGLVVIGLSIKASRTASKLTAVLKSETRAWERGDRVTEGLANLARALSKLGSGCAVVMILYSLSTINIAPQQSNTATEFLDAALCLLNEAIANTPNILKKHRDCNTTFASLGVMRGETPDYTKFEYSTRPSAALLGISFLCPAAVHLLYAVFYL